MRASGRETFEAWATARQQTFLRNAYLMTGDFHRAEDLVQEALIRAAARWDVLSAGNPDAWMRTVMYAANRRRRHRLGCRGTAHAASPSRCGRDGRVRRHCRRTRGGGGRAAR